MSNINLSLSNTTLKNKVKDFFASPIGRELIRKMLHISIAFIALILNYSFALAFTILVLGATAYITSEILRYRGIAVPFITFLTTTAQRDRDVGHIVFGPLTLALGSMLAMLFFPTTVAQIGILALAFGDGIASLVGRAFGRYRPAFLNGKSIEGSLACFIATFFAIYFILKQSLILSLVVALITTIIEAFPLKNLDNIAIPIGVSFLILPFFI